MPKGYWVTIYRKISDPAKLAAYAELAPKATAPFGGKYIARGGPVETLEGHWPCGRFVILEFPSAERAREWWASEAYRPAKELRHATARSRMILVEGMGG